MAVKVEFIAPKPAATIEGGVRSAAVGLLLLACIWTASVRASDLNPPRWQIEIVDDGGGHDVGMYSALAINRDGAYQVAYYDSTSRALWYAFRRNDDRHWSKMLVDQEAGTFVSLAVDSEGRPHMAYNSTRGLRYAYWSDERWRIQTIDPVQSEFSTAIQLDQHGYPRLAYLELPSSRAQKGGLGRLEYAYFDGSAWFRETIEEQPAQEPYDSLAVDAAGEPHIVYAEFKRLHYAYTKGSQWIFESIEPLLDQHVVAGLSLAIDTLGHPYVAYFDETKQTLNLVARTDGSWKSEVVDQLFSAPEFPGGISLKLDSRNQPHIAYSDAGPGMLKYAVRKNGKWATEVVDRQAAGNTSPCLSLDSRDQPFISYYDATDRQVHLAHPAEAKAVASAMRQATRSEGTSPSRRWSEGQLNPSRAQE